MASETAAGNLAGAGCVFSTEHRSRPAALLDIALKAMQPNPAQRYQSVDDLAADLKRYQAGMAGSAHRESPLERFSQQHAGAVAVSAVGWAADA